ncbi:sensor histidine kinase [Fictibacillus barbaricus]|uniref:histidine kinase n=1 Tax=Fictibacillus barbaricus TaxID=182136 RepID=A0ABS2Z9H7_9BACL|nr:HAMP domain-containing sensor histidine kinase [Fictibacillus barbaricus]MBN3544530.1 HAMP domain-containing histidine kinase [Fictibacillus barbaricus]GGB65984.1 sensor histidine kinase CssS [Fictibacillus barbaricus]
MIRLNLTQRIWLSFGLLLFTIGLLTAIIYPLSIKDTLTEETYRIIENEQQNVWDPQNQFQQEGESPTDFIERRNAARDVGHFYIVDKYANSQGDPVPQEVLFEMAEKAYEQKKDQGRYELTYEDATLFYAISTKINEDGQKVFLISYMWDTYRDQMVNRLWLRLVLILLFTGIFSIIPAIWLARYLRSPLIILGKRFEQIAKRNWQEPFHWKGDDEFYILSRQFEEMRQNLLRHDHAQKTFIQHASHELKTPIMTIKSYAQSVKDGIMPKKTTEDMMDVILKETQRMEKRVQNMLYYTKLDAMKLDVISKETFNFGDLAEDIVERFRYQREDIHFEITGNHYKMHGDKEQWGILLDNLVQNALRYALNTIRLSAFYKGSELIIEVFNDGDHITDVEGEEIFQPFRKGNKGQFGLGLAIVKRIAELHGGNVVAQNTRDGVVFQIRMQMNGLQEKG